MIVQRNNQIVVTAGEGSDRLIALVRQCGLLSSIVAGSQVYELSSIALWGYAARRGAADDLLLQLRNASANELPNALVAWIVQTMARYGVLRLSEIDGHPYLFAATDEPFKRLGLVADARDGEFRTRIEVEVVGRIRVEAARAGWFIADDRRSEALREPAPIAFSGILRTYQQDALNAFLQGRQGLVLLPCGGGKTVVGVAAAASTGGPVLVVVPSRSIALQWQRMFENVTDILSVDVAVNRIGRGVSIVTYHSAVGRRAGELLAHDWRLVVFDEVQSLPAETFRLASQIRADFRMGLTATLVREDGREREIAALVGPPLFDISWRALERQGWIAPARCIEVRVPAATSEREAMLFRMSVVERLLARHATESVLVVGSRLASLEAAGDRLGFPVVTGRDSPDVRERTLGQFRDGSLRVLGVSRIGSVGIDLPGASVMIQVSGTFGSRQEEAQRLGRILRPSEANSAHFYTIVETGTREVGDAERRQRFLVNQGYIYEVVEAASIARPARD